jgi:hypothetical protein
MLMSHIKQMNNENFDDYVLHGWTPSLPDPLVKSKSTQKQPEKYPMSASLFSSYTQQLLSARRKFLLTQLQENSFITPEDLFGIAQVNQIMLSFKEIGTEEQCRHIIGGEYVDRLAAEVFRTISNMKMSPMYVAHIAWVQQNEADDTLVKTANYCLTKDEIIFKNSIKAAHLADQAEVL